MKSTCYVKNMYVIQYSHYKSIGYVWRGIKTISRPQKLYRAGTAPPVYKFLDPPLSFKHDCLSTTAFFETQIKDFLWKFSFFAEGFSVLQRGEWKTAEQVTHHHNRDFVLMLNSRGREWSIWRFKIVKITFDKCGHL